MYDKKYKVLRKTVRKDPNNLEAVAVLADYFKERGIPTGEYLQFNVARAQGQHLVPNWKMSNLERALTTSLPKYVLTGIFPAPRPNNVVRYIVQTKWLPLHVEQYHLGLPKVVTTLPPDLIVRRPIVHRKTYRTACGELAQSAYGLFLNEIKRPIFAFTNESNTYEIMRDLIQRAQCMHFEDVAENNQR